MAIATTANLLLGLRWAVTGREYVDAMVTEEGMDRDLADASTQYILIPMMPFAVELCLKGIRSQRGDFLPTHNLKSLWVDLDDEDRTEIRLRTDDLASRSEERARREMLGVAAIARSVDEVVTTHQHDFVRWRYVVDGERTLTENSKQVKIDEAIMDLYGIVYACVEYHRSRSAE